MKNSIISLIAPTLMFASLGGCQSGPESTRSDHVDRADHAAHADDANAARQLEQVKAMAGTWYLADAEGGDAPTAIYRVVANETAVEERLFPGQEKEMITMYFIDEGRLTLTHFCALGNQPTMGAVEGGPDEINFGFIGITDLASPTSQHMHEHTLEFHDDPDRVDSTWILWNDGAEAERRLFPLERRMSISN